MKVLKFLQRSPAPLRPIPVGIEEIFLLRQAPCDIWIYRDALFHLLFKKKGAIHKGMIQELIACGNYRLFVRDDEIDLMRKALQQHLKQVSRTLGAGDSLDNGLGQMNLLSTNMAHLYKGPSDDENLKLQYGSAKNLVNFLSSNKKYIPPLYGNFTKQNYHYSVGHPLLSSLLLLSFLKYLNHLSEREIEQLVLSNYFKDIGMSLIPLEAFDKKNLNQFEKDSIGQHTRHSIDILKGRVPLHSDYLEIIGNHHNHSLINSDNTSHHRYSQETETILILMMDMIVAMISPRPYRSGMSLYDALQKIKLLFGKDFPQEFHYLVYFLQQFFSRTKQFARS